MTKYRESKAALTSKTYDRNEMEGSTENIYEALSIIAKRSFCGITGNLFLYTTTRLSVLTPTIK